MKAHFHLVPRAIEQSYLSRHHILPNFGTVWHYHPEIELHYIIRGEGVRFVGDNISNFDSGEMLLLGENLPHMWRCDDHYFQNDPEISAEAIVVQWLPDFIGKTFLEMKENNPIITLYEKARAGLMITGETKKKLVGLMHRSSEVEGFNRILTILLMLEILSDSKDLIPITIGHNAYRSNKEETARLNKVYQFTLQNYCRELTLEEIAGVANLSVTSFCRYFKMMTKKTFHEFLIELRISHAKRLLMEDNFITTEAICFESGFNNRSNFFRHFKEIVGSTPQEFRNKCIREELI
ncbi:AraC family transcriptional regulator [Pollutibacter soli]|uniref:AraC family transcriptional regulator n=1 Tax=Pollutibacter soli TaxID=3034157 RepID=UPI003013306F